MLLVPLATGPLAIADVGLPEYQDPIQQSESSRSSAGHNPIIKQISHGADWNTAGPLSCDPAAQTNGTALDLAPPPDKRVDDWGPKLQNHTNGSNHAEVRIPLYLNGNRAVLKTGEVVNSIKAIESRGKLVLLSEDNNYFHRLQAIRPMDKLLVQTAQTVRHYLVTRASIMRAGTEVTNDSSADTLTLAACYPFQPIEGTPLLYVVRARAIPATPRPEEAAAAEPVTLNF